MIRSRKRINKTLVKALGEGNDSKPLTLKKKFLRRLEKLEAREQEHLGLLGDHVNEARQSLGAFPTNAQVDSLKLAEKLHEKFEAHLSQSPYEESCQDEHGVSDTHTGEPAQGPNHVDSEVMEENAEEHQREDIIEATTTLAPRSLVNKKTKKLIQRRNKIDRELICESERKTIDKGAYKRRQILLERQMQLKQDELAHLRILTSRHKQAQHFLAKNRGGCHIKDECRLRRVIDIFKAHLGPYLDDTDFDSIKSCQEVVEERHETELHDATDNSTSKRKFDADEVEDRAPKKAKSTPVAEASQPEQDGNGGGTEYTVPWTESFRHATLSPDSGDEDERELRRAEYRRRLDQIVAPHLNDNGIVYDLPTTQMETDPDAYMSGGLFTLSDLSSLLSTPVKSEMSDDSEALPSERRKVHRVLRKIIPSFLPLQGVEDDRTDSNSISQPATEDGHVSQPMHSPELATEHDQESGSITERLTTQNVNHLHNTKAPAPMPKDWGDSKSKPRGSGTRISGPSTPALQSLKVDGSGQKAYNCLQPEKPPSQAKSRKPRYSTYGKSTTPIPVPVTPVATSTGKVKAMSSESSPAPEPIATPSRSATPVARRRGGWNRATDRLRAVAGNPGVHTLSPGRIGGQSRLLVPRGFPGSAQDDRRALEIEKKWWRSMLNL